MAESNYQHAGVVGRRDDAHETIEERRDREAKLVALCIRGHRDALRILVLDYADAVAAGAKKAMRELGRPISKDVNDLLQEFWANLLSYPLRVLGRFGAGRGPLASWLATAAYLHAQHFIRKQSLRHPVSVATSDPADLDSLPAPTVPIIRPEALLARLLERLSSMSGSILQEYYGLGPSAIPRKVGEIATSLGVSESSVYRKLTVIHRRMWQELELEGVHRLPKRRRKPAHDP